LDPAALEPFLDKERGKEKVRGTPLRTLAFLVIVHARAQRGQVEEALPLLKGNAAFKTALFGELTAHAAGSYDMKPVLALAIQESRAKGESTVRTACEVLWTLARRGVDIGEAIPHLFENQLRLGMFCSAPQVVATYFIRQGRLDRLHAWATDPDEKKRQWAWRGVNISGRQGVDLAGVRADARFRSLWPELMGSGKG
jgi:hypothetical protein